MKNGNKKKTRIPKNCIGKGLNEPFKSNRKFKKRQVCVKDNSGKIVNIHYGDNRYDDYLIHADKERRRLFRLRHECDPISKLNKASAKYWACQDLW